MTTRRKKSVISVIIPAYNEKITIRNCLTSVINQTLDPDLYEIIVVNNNSTDKTYSIIKNEFPKVILINEKKQGVVFARIAGIERAHGEFVSFIDADSVASPYWLEKIYDTFQDKQVVAVGSNANFQPKNYLVRTVEPIMNSINKRMKYINGWNLSIRMSAYKKIGGFSIKTNGTEDFYISLKLKGAGKIKILGGNQVTTSSRRYHLKHFLPYATKSLINQASILLFDRGLLLNFPKSSEPRSI